MTRRHFLGLLTAAGAAFPPSPACAQRAARLELAVDRGAWGTASAEDVAAMLEAAAGTIWERCAQPRLRPIRVYRRRDFPLTNSTPDFHGRIGVGLTAENARWAQFAFQFAHEFGHVLARHSEPGKRGWRSLRHVNMWLEESLCEAASLFALRRLGATARADAALFSGYAEARLGRSEHQLPEGETFAEWFARTEPELRANPVWRAKNIIVARELLPLLEQHPSGWESLCFLNLGTREGRKPLSLHLAQWRANCPPGVAEFIGRIGAVFA